MVNISYPLRVFAVIFALITGPVSASDRPLSIFAAASLSDVLTDIAGASAPAPRLSFGGSGAIARQIDQGAPADVVILANPAWMDWLEDRGLIRPGTRAAPFGNALVLVGPPNAPELSGLSTESLLARLGETGRLAMGEHRSVPAGQYARMWLDGQGMWAALKPRLSETENVRAALALVTRGEVPLAIVYASDLVAAPDAATAVWTIPPSEQPAIRYSIAALTPGGDALVEELQSPEMLARFAAYGFTVEKP